MSAPTKASGIVGYVGRGSADQRARIEAAVASVGLIAMEIVEEWCLPTFTGRTGLERLYQLAGRSDVTSIVVTEFEVLFSNPLFLARWRREMAFKHGVYVFEAKNLS